MCGGLIRSIVLQLLSLLAFFARKEVAATIMIPELSVSYHSMPAMFGKKWPTTTHGDVISYRAHLQMIPHRPFLCDHQQQHESSKMEQQHDVNSNNINDKENEDSEEDEDDDDVAVQIQPQQNHTTARSSSATTTSTTSTTKTPSDGLPIALLVERGHCTFYEKSVVAASSMYPGVAFMIVYDNQSNNNPLIPMTSDHDNDNDDNDNEDDTTWITRNSTTTTTTKTTTSSSSSTATHDNKEEIGLLFVSHNTGLGKLYSEKKRFTHTQKKHEGAIFSSSSLWMRSMMR